LPPGQTAGVLGLTYKPNTDVVEEAVGLLLAEALIARGVALVAYDPQGARNSALALGPGVRLAATAEECIAESAVVVVATPWPEFARIPAERWERRGAPRIVLDCWRALPHLAGREGIVRMSLGVGSEPAESVSQGASRR
jgi:UDPglucose 6-dehydrogenase